MKRKICTCCKSPYLNEIKDRDELNVKKFICLICSAICKESELEEEDEEKSETKLSD
jgi:hypothetical protein